MSSFGVQPILVDGPNASAAMIHSILDGAKGPPRDIVVMNSAAALVAAGIETSTLEAANHAVKAIDSGAARFQLDELVRVSSSSPTE